MLGPMRGRRGYGALVRVALWAAFQAVAAAVPLSFSSHSLNLDASGRARLLAVDGAGNGYEVSSILDSSGRAWIRVTRTDSRGALTGAYDFGGTGQDVPAAIALGAGGSVVIVGSTSSTDFPFTRPPAPGLAKSAAFVTSLDSGLTRVISSVALGGGSYAASYQGPGTSATAVAVDAGGNVYVCGSTAALDFPVTNGALQTRAPGHDAFGSATYAFLAKLSPDLSQVIDSTYYGSDGVSCTGSGCIGAFANTMFTALAVAPDGSLTAAGSTNHDTVTQITAGAFVVKISGDLGKVMGTSARQPDPGGRESILSLALDTAGNAVLTGTATNAGTQGPNALTASCAQGGFLWKVDNSAQNTLFSTYFGCAGSIAPMASVNGAALDSAGTIWITGSGAEVLPAPADTPSGGTAFVAGIASDGSAVKSLYLFSEGMAGRSIAAANSVLYVLGDQGWLLLAQPGNGPSLTGVANSAGSGPSGLIAPAELVSFYGQNLGPSSPLGGQISNGVLSNALGGYQLMFDATAAPLLYVGAGQVNAVVPLEVLGRDSVEVTLVRPQDTTVIAHLFLRPSQPEIFHDPRSGGASAINENGQINSASNPARSGEIVTVWATGAGLPAGDVLPQDGTVVSAGSLRRPALPISVLAPAGPSLANPASLEVLYAGDAPGAVFGVTQVNFRLPESLPPGSSSLTVWLQAGAAISAPVSLHVAP